MPGAANEFLNVRETAGVLGVHVNTIRNWVKSGVLISSRVAGSTAHRFSREYIERVARERGEAKAAAAPSFSTIGPELARATDIDRWAASMDAKSAFPDLMRRLLSGTKGITNLEMRANEGVAAPGWDGSATARNVTHLPDGPLRFELGTDASPKQKAQSDYENRVPPSATDAEATFVFVTPRNWATANSWASDRQKEGDFAGVRALDAHSLETWLLAVPAVHYWFSERLGYRPRDAQTISAWWDRFSARTDPKIPSEFFLAGRDEQTEELRTLLSSADTTKPITIIAPWLDEVLAFIYAVTSSTGEAEARTVVVREASAWSRIIESRTPLILIPRFRDDLDIAAAIDRGHQVLLPANGEDLVRGENQIALPRVGRVAGAAALAEAFKETPVDGLVALGRRSMPALFRKLGRENRHPQPEWVTDRDIAAVLAPLMAVGSWTRSEGDQLVIERLTGVPRSHVERLVKSLSTLEDPPFVLSGGAWTLASPVEAALGLLPQLTCDQLATWSDVALEVLLEEDPFDGMDTFQRMEAQSAGVHRVTSGALKRGLANGLALAGASSSDLATPDIQQHVDRVVSRLLQTASADGDGSGWVRISAALPALAEASPKMLMREVDEDLASPEPQLRALFRDTKSDLWGPSSPHPSLLWALETLCWSSTYFMESASLLARVAKIDPGGRLSNRPAESLSSVAQGWVPNSSADVDAKIDLANLVARRDPEIGWRLVLDLMPQRHAVSSPPHSPKYRDWAPARSAITLAGWGAFVEQICSLAAELAGTDASRWAALVPKIDDVPAPSRTRLVDALEAAVADSKWSHDERIAVWRALEKEVLQHREFSSSDWAMPPEDVGRFEQLARALQPEENPQRFASAFRWRTFIPGVERGSEEYLTERQRLQEQALDAILPQGSDALEVLAKSVDDTHSLGRILGSRDDALDAVLFKWLHREDEGLVRAAMAFVGVRTDSRGLSWLEDLLGSDALTTDLARIRALGTLRFGRQEWEWARTLPDELQSHYWASVQPFAVEPPDLEDAVSVLVDHGRPWAALAILPSNDDKGPKPSVATVEKVIDCLLVTEEPPRDRQMISYYLEQALRFIEQEQPDHPRLPFYEFAFFDALEGHEPSTALYRLLNTDVSEFVSLVKSVYRGEDEPAQEPSAQDRARAHLAWSVLHEWKLMPGARPDGTIDAEHLTTWVREARLAFSESGRTSIGDEVIGEILATSPNGADGAWPAEPVREIIETVGSPRLDTGVGIRRYNQRGVNWRNAFDGGAQERSLEDTYRDMAAKVSRWPRTRRIVDGLADDFARDARRHDDESERLSDDG